MLDRITDDIAEDVETRLCDYCHESPAEGYVAAYDAQVCRECYEDHHGPCC